MFPLLSSPTSFLFSSPRLFPSASSPHLSPLYVVHRSLGGHIWEFVLDGCVVNCERVQDNIVSLTWSDMENLVSTQWVSQFTSPCFGSSHVVVDGLRVHEQNLFDITQFWWVVCADDFSFTFSFWIVWVEVHNIKTKVCTFTPWLVRHLCHVFHPSD